MTGGAQQPDHVTDLLPDNRCLLSRQRALDVVGRAEDIPQRVRRDPGGQSAPTRLGEQQEQLAGIAAQRAATQVEVAQPQQRVAVSLSAAETVHRLRETQIPVARGPPGQRRAIHISRETHRQRLPVAAVAPVRDQIAAGAVAQPVLGRSREIRAHVGRAAGQAIPRRRAGAHVKRQTRRGEQRAVRVERMIGLIPPLQRQRVARHLAHQLGVTNDDVAPKGHAPPARRDPRMDLLQKIQIHAPFSARAHLRR